MHYHLEMARLDYALFMCLPLVGGFTSSCWGESKHSLLQKFSVQVIEVFRHSYCAYSLILLIISVIFVRLTLVDHGYQINTFYDISVFKKNTQCSTKILSFNVFMANMEVLLKMFLSWKLLTDVFWIGSLQKVFGPTLILWEVDFSVILLWHLHSSTLQYLVWGMVPSL